MHGGARLPTPPGPVGRMRTRWTLFRNWYLASPAFHRFAFRFPLFRPIALSRSRAVFDLIAGFVYAQITVAFVESGLLAALGEAPTTLETAAAVAGLPGEEAERLLRAAAALGLAEEVPAGRWTLGRHGAAMLGTTGVLEMIAHHRALYADLADPLSLLRRGGGGGALAGYWPYAAGADIDAGAAAIYSRLMAASQPAVAAEVLAAYPFRRHRHVLDIGGGEGAFLEAVHVAAPQVQRSLFDLPAVAARAAERLGPSVAVHAGHFLCDPLPEGADLVTLVRIAHDHDDGTVRQLFHRIRAMLPPGGRLLIAEPMAEVPGAERMGHAYFGFYLLAMGSGRPRTAAELSDMLRSSGFSRVQQIPTRTPLVTQLVVASR